MRCSLCNRIIAALAALNERVIDLPHDGIRDERVDENVRLCGGASIGATRVMHQRLCVAERRHQDERDPAVIVARCDK